MEAERVMPVEVNRAVVYLYVFGGLMSAIGGISAMSAGHWWRAAQIVAGGLAAAVIARLLSRGVPWARELLVVTVVCGIFFAVRQSSDVFDVVLSASILSQFAWSASRLYRAECGAWFSAMRPDV